MIKIAKEYEDYNGEKKVQDFWFHLNEVELTEMTAMPAGGLDGFISNAINSNDDAAMLDFFKDLLLRAYGEKTQDGRFIKEDELTGAPLSRRFKQTAAFPLIYMELAQDADKAAEFVNGCVPKDMTASMSKVFADTEKQLETQSLSQVAHSIRNESKQR